MMVLPLAVMAVTVMVVTAAEREVTPPSTLKTGALLLIVLPPAVRAVTAGLMLPAAREAMLPY